MTPWSTSQIERKTDPTTITAQTTKTRAILPAAIIILPFLNSDPTTRSIRVLLACLETLFLKAT